MLWAEGERKLMMEKQRMGQKLLGSRMGQARHSTSSPASKTTQTSHPPTMPPPPPPLPEEILEEIFLRLPPDEPGSLVRASLASKLWLGILTGARFRGLCRDLHGAPPMLGFIYSCVPDHHLPNEVEEDNNLPHFVATAKFQPHIPAVEDWSWRGYAAWDCRHGRVLLCNNNSVTRTRLVVWDPMTGRRTSLNTPEEYYSHAAAVLCNAPGCDHRACHMGSFELVYVGVNVAFGASLAYAHVSSSSDPRGSDIGDAVIVDKPAVFIQDALYFMLAYALEDDDNCCDLAILKYDLGSSCLSLIDGLPVETCPVSHVVLVAMEDASLGFAHVDPLTLNLWSSHIGSSGAMTWTRRRVIDLTTLLPIQDPKGKLTLAGSVERKDIIFITMDLGIYEINLKSVRLKKIWKRVPCRSLFPYMSFYNPPAT